MEQINLGWLYGITSNEAIQRCGKLGLVRPLAEGDCSF
jgi:hypothetical protein